MKFWKRKIKLKKIKSFFDKSFWLFVFIGCINTVISLSLQFVFYSLKIGYWISTSLAFIISSVFSYYLNRKYSFKNKDRVVNTALKFALVIAVCYVFAYSVAQPFSKFILQIIIIDENVDLTNKLAMLIGQVIFAFLNYTGQRFFTFRKKECERKEKS